MCQNCICNFCANSCELYSEYRTPGEATEACFSCDDCRRYDGNWEKRDLYRQSCPNYIEARKYAENRAMVRRAKLRMISREVELEKGNGDPC